MLDAAKETSNGTGKLVNGTAGIWQRLRREQASDFPSELDSLCVT